MKKKGLYNCRPDVPTGRESQRERKPQKTKILFTEIEQFPEDKHCVFLFLFSPEPNTVPDVEQALKK